MKNTSLTELLAARVAAKQIEEDAIESRREIDAQIADYLRGDTAEGTVTLKEDLFKVSATYKIDRKVEDADVLAVVWPSLTPAVQAAFVWKPTVSVSGLRKLGETDALVAAQFIVSKEASPSIKVEVI
jgi:hypothetical protein